MHITARENQTHFLLAGLNFHLSWCFYLHGDTSAALQFVAWGEGDACSNGGRRAGLQAVAGTNELWQGLQGVDPQLNELTLECERAQGSAGSLEGGIN